MPRLFIAVDPGKDVLANVERVMTRLRSKSPGSKWVKPEGMHVTLVFLGDVPDEQVDAVAKAAGEVAKKHSPLGLKFEGGDSFGSPKKPRVLWVGVTGDVDRLIAIQKDLADALKPLGYEGEDRPFSPHLTLARAGEQRGDAPLADCAAVLAKETFGETAIGALVIYRSDLSPKGATYTALHELGLGG